MLAPRHNAFSRSVTPAVLSPHASRALTLAVLAAVHAPVVAQRQFAQSGNGVPAAAWSVAMVDVDGDADLDMVRGIAGKLVGLFLNDGRGRFMDVTSSNLPVRKQMPPRDMATGDFDGDGDQDLVFVGEGFRGLYVNDGSGVFTDASSRLPAILSLVSQSVVVGDVDGDGDLDIVVGNSYALRGDQDRLFQNDGAGHFTDVTAQGLPQERDLTIDMALGDVDGDGDLDLLCGAGYYSGAWQSWNRNRLYLNDGQGRFTNQSSRLPAHVQSTTSVALGDVDGDGDLDIAISNYGNYSPDVGNRLYINSGGAVFRDVTATQMPRTSRWTEGIALGDVDDDGDLDMVLAIGAVASGPGVLLNDGGGTFLIPSTPRVGGGFYAPPLFGDLDGDGDLDLASISAGVHINLLRQVDAPKPPQIGVPYRLDFYARYGPERSSDVFVPALSTAPASVPLPPYGTLGIDLARAVTLAPVPVPQPAGVASITIPVPGDPGLRGLTLFTQAVLFQNPPQPRLTNVTLGVVR